jgi:aryl-alcohol dehydrogenase-like predicted oxidoreductase
MVRPLGKSGIQVSAMGMGCWAIGGPFTTEKGVPVGWSDVDDNQSIRAVHRALDLGVNFFDTADLYGTGHSEEILGKAISGRRDNVVIATKFGCVINEESKQWVDSTGSPEYMRKALEASLRRLNTDYIDLYQFHYWGYPAEEAGPVRDALEEAVEEGKIRGYGWSTDKLDSVEVFAEGPNCIAVQQRLNVLAGSDELLAFCEANNLASVNRSPLAMGLLTGKFKKTTEFPANDLRSETNWFGGFDNGNPDPIWLEKLDAIRDILASKRRTLAQGALAWIWARSNNTIPIPGFKSVEQVEENSAAMQFGPLEPDQMREIDHLLGRNSVKF